MSFLGSVAQRGGPLDVAQRPGPLRLGSAAFGKVSGPRVFLCVARCNARTVADRRILRRLGPQWMRDGTAETAMFSMVLEDEVRRVMSDLVIEVTNEMLQAKLKDMDKQIS